MLQKALLASCAEGGTTLTAKVFHSEGSMDSGTLFSSVVHRPCEWTCMDGQEKVNRSTRNN